MCHNCNNNSCGGCNQPCPSYPPITVPVPGPTGPVGPVGPGVSTEVGAFGRVVANGSGSFIVSTLKKVKMIFFSSSLINPAVPGVGSQGQGCPGSNFCIAFNPAASLDSINAINAVSLGDGFTAVVTSVGPVSGFILNWTMLGAGHDITVKWQAITEA